MASKKKTAKRSSKKKSTKPNRHEVLIDGPSRKPRPNKATVYLSDDHAFNTALLAAASSLNGRKYNRSAIIEEALNLWFAQADLPDEYHLRLKLD